MRTSGNGRSAEVPSAETRPWLESRLCAAGALSQTEHIAVRGVAVPAPCDKHEHQSNRRDRLALGLQTVYPQAKTPPSAQETSDDAAHATLQEAQRFFYNGDYDEAAAVTHVLCSERPDNLNACELRTASLHFQIKKALGETGQRGNKTTAWTRWAHSAARPLG